jgi:prophage regulatory protein
MSAQQPASFLRLPEVLRRVGLSRATVYAQIKQGSFPYPVSLGPRSVAWIDNEIQSWIDGRISAARGGVQ